MVIAVELHTLSWQDFFLSVHCYYKTSSSPISDLGKNFLSMEQASQCHGFSKSFASLEPMGLRFRIKS